MDQTSKPQPTESIMNKMPLSSIFDGKDHETFVSINLALQALNMEGTPPQLREIAEQALIELLKATFEADNLN
jgi:hypothetical protein